MQTILFPFLNMTAEEMNIYAFFSEYQLNSFFFFGNTQVDDETVGQDCEQAYCVCFYFYA
jgi:hypothetical protein